MTTAPRTYLERMTTSAGSEDARAVASSSSDGRFAPSASTSDRNACDVFARSQSLPARDAAPRRHPPPVFRRLIRAIRGSRRERSSTSSTVPSVLPSSTTQIVYRPPAREHEMSSKSEPMTARSFSTGTHTPTSISLASIDGVTTSATARRRRSRRRRRLRRLSATDGDELDRGRRLHVPPRVEDDRPWLEGPSAELGVVGPDEVTERTP